MSSEILIKLELIKPNPWQPREDQDPETIEKLAQSIKTDGLMQIPTARPMADGTYQLAFGHRRFAAFKLLDDNSGYRNDWITMPLIIRTLSDEDMFRYAVSENIKRQDLTPIEEAKSMIRYRDEFGKSSVEIGELYGLSDSAVRNKIRLLKLPALVQDLLRRRQITEGAARGLVNMYELTNDELLAAEEVDDAIKPSEIIEISASGAPPQQIARLVEQLVERVHPRVEQTALPYLPSVSTETVETPEPEEIPEEFQPGEAEVEEIPAEMLDEAMPDEHLHTPVVVSKDAPTLAAMTKDEHEALHSQSKPLTEAYLKQNAPQKSAPAPTPAPAPAPVEPAKPLTWAESTISMTLTFWPDDGDAQGRMVVIGTRVNQNAPKMQMLRQESLQLPVQLATLLADLNRDFGGEQ